MMTTTQEKKTLSSEEIHDMLVKHQKFIDGNKTGTLARFVDCNLCGVDFRKYNLKLVGVYFENCLMNRTNFKGCDICGTEFHNCELTCSFFDGAKAMYCNFVNCDCKRLFARTTNLLDSTFEDCILNGAYFFRSSMRNIRMVRVNAEKAFFDESDLTEASITGCNLRRADFKRANLVYCTATDTDWSGAYFNSTDMRCARFYGDNNIAKTIFGHNTCVACLRGLPIYQASRGFGGRDSALTLVADGKREEWRWFTGCFAGTEDELKNAIKDEHGDSPEAKRYYMTINHLISIAESCANQIEKKSPHNQKNS